MKAEIYPVLNAILFGEGIVNDAIAIVLYRIENLEVINFVSTLFFSLLIGVSGGVLTGLYFKRVKMENGVKEMGIVILTNYLVYLVAELSDMSGILALFVSGVSSRLYVVGNLTLEA
jgi:NhaP-type Na+/H+ or K+/H+ antiporter